MKALWRIDLLGELRVSGQDRAITRFRTRKAAALLAYLAYYGDRAHSRLPLAEMLWPERELDSAPANLRVALSSLHRQLEPPGVPAGTVLIADRAFRAAQPGGGGHGRKRASSRRCRPPCGPRTGRNGSATLLPRSPPDLGELLPGLLEPWVLPERQRLAEAFHRAASLLIRDLEAEGDLPGALEIARRAASTDPLREGSHQLLIRLLLAAGREDAALAAYHDLEQLLAAELGTTPLAEIQALLASRRARDRRPGDRAPAAGGP
jgi:DNA-binding SARP family transcriptional activator